MTLIIDFNQIDDGQPNWLSESAAKRRTAKRERSLQLIREKIAANFALRRKEFDESKIERDDRGRFASTGGGGDSGSGDSSVGGDSGSKPYAGYEYIDSSAPDFQPMIGVPTDYKKVWDKTEIEYAQQRLSVTMQRAKENGEPIRKKLVQSNAGVLANIAKLDRKHSELNTKLLEEFNKVQALREAARILNHPVDLWREKETLKLVERDHAVAYKNLVEAKHAAAAKARAAYVKHAKVENPVPIAMQVEKDANIRLSTLGEAENFLKGIIGSVQGYYEAGVPFTIPVKQVPKDQKQRAYASNGTVYITPQDGPSVLLHEIGHAIEHRYPDAARACRAFLKNRVGDEKMIDMKDKFGGGYEPGEMGRQDQFLKAMGDENSAFYTGKHYEYGHTEILSMGLQKLYENPAEFAKADPEYFHFVTGILRGDLRT